VLRLETPYCLPQPNVRGIIMSFKAPDVPHEQQCAKGLIGYETTKSQT
jgi:hypothetical protein